jgi:hypothetical protein
MTPPLPRLAAALHAAERGWPVFPVYPYSKYPAVPDWEHRATRDLDQITRWWQQPRSISASPVGPPGWWCSTWTPATASYHRGSGPGSVSVTAVTCSPSSPIAPGSPIRSTPTPLPPPPGSTATSWLQPNGNSAQLRASGLVHRHPRRGRSHHRRRLRAPGQRPAPLVPHRASA